MSSHSSFEKPFSLSLAWRVVYDDIFGWLLRSYSWERLIPWRNHWQADSYQLSSRGLCPTFMIRNVGTLRTLSKIFLFCASGTCANWDIVRFWMVQLWIAKLLNTSWEYRKILLWELENGAAEYLHHTLNEWTFFLEDKKRKEGK